MSRSLHPAAQRFEAVADEYERARPDYSPDVVEVLRRELDIGPGRRTLDLGAGTGKLTRMLVPLGAPLVAVEPLEAMSRRFGQAVPGVPMVGALAEALPFRDSTFHGVICAQAFHWFDGPHALAEIHRVLEPGGALGLVWNVKDETLPWVRALGDILRPHQNKVPQETTGQWRRAFESTGLFGPIGEARVPHAQPLSGPGLVERYATASYIAMLPDRERDEVLQAIRELTETHPDLRERDAFDLPYVTEVYWTRRR